MLWYIHSCIYNQCWRLYFFILCRQQKLRRPLPYRQPWGSGAENNTSISTIIPQSLPPPTHTTPIAHNPYSPPPKQTHAAPQPAFVCLLQHIPLLKWIKPTNKAKHHYQNNMLTCHIGWSSWAYASEWHSWLTLILYTVLIGGHLAQLRRVSRAQLISRVWRRLMTISHTWIVLAGFNVLWWCNFVLIWLVWSSVWQKKCQEREQ